MKDSRPSWRIELINRMETKQCAWTIAIAVRARGRSVDIHLVPWSLGSHLPSKAGCLGQKEGISLVVDGICENARRGYVMSMRGTRRQRREAQKNGLRTSSLCSQRRRRSSRQCSRGLRLPISSVSSSRRTSCARLSSTSNSIWSASSLSILIPSCLTSSPSRLPLSLHSSSLLIVLSPQDPWRHIHNPWRRLHHACRDVDSGLRCVTGSMPCQQTLHLC